MMRCTKTAIILLAISALVLIPACNIVAPVLFVVHGPPKTYPLFKLGASRPTVIFIDDRTNIAPRRALRGIIARRAETDLLDKGVLTTIIDSRAAFKVASKDDLSAPMPIGEIGLAVGAEVLIYVTLDSFTLSPQHGGIKPSATARVKILDIKNKQRLWPSNPKGFPLRVALPQAPSYGSLSGSQRIKAENDLALWLGTGLAQMFYTHETSTSALAR